jgi:hypothetical protein
MGNVNNKNPDQQPNQTKQRSTEKSDQTDAPRQGGMGQGQRGGRDMSSTGQKGFDEKSRQRQGVDESTEETERRRRDEESSESSIDEGDRP